MKIKDLSEYAASEVAALMARIPFFKELQQKDSEQLAVLLAHSCIVELDPGETIMRRGDRGAWLYFLIKGQLAVYLDEPGHGQPLNQITPGELFGDLALLCDYERKATVATEPTSRPAVLFATDFKPFGDLGNFEQVTLATKLLFYRTMVHSIRWRLEQKRSELTDASYANDLRKCPFFHGEKGSFDELENLHQQARYLALVLDRWNAGASLMQGIMVASEAMPNEH